MKKLLFLLLLIPLLCFASPTEITTTGTYIMGDGETPLVAEERALVAAKQAAVEQAGTYIESSSETQNWELTKDEVNVISAGIMQVDVLDKQRELIPGGGMKITVKIKAKVDTDSVAAMKDRLTDKRLVESYKLLQSAYQNVNNNLVTVKSQLETAKSSIEKQKTQQALSNNERTVLALNQLDEGLSRYGHLPKKTPEYAKKTASHFTDAINYKSPEIADEFLAIIYLLRGITNFYAVDFNASLADFNMATSIGLPERYYTQVYFYETAMYAGMHREEEAEKARKLFDIYNAIYPIKNSQK